MDKQKELVNEYVNRFADLEYKNRKKDERFTLLVLLSVFVIEYLTAPRITYVNRYAPFIKELELDKPEKTIQELHAGVMGEGKLKGEIKAFKDNLPHYNYIINQHKNIMQTETQNKDFFKRDISDLQVELQNKAKAYEEANNINLFTNQMLFNKKEKIWNTQRDDRVRKTTFHNGVADMKTKISEPFIVGGFKAMYPSDSSLPNYERYNCRCYLTYK